MTRRVVHRVQLAPRDWGRHRDGTGSRDVTTEARGDALGFDDLLDLMNPLQHIPVISTLYRAFTGDEIRAPMEVAGGALFGGPLGFVAALANVFIDDVAGQDLGDLALAALTGDEASDGTQVAALTPARQSAALATSEPPATDTIETGAAETSDAVAPPVAAPLAASLTGEEALQALAADLRGLAGGGAPPTATPPKEASPLVPVADDVAATLAGVVPSAFDSSAATLSAGGFAARMMQALDRYEEMAKAPTAARAGAIQVDTEL